MIILKIVLGYFLLAEAYIFLMSRHKKLEDFDFILVLGNKGGLKSPVAKDRILKALLAKKKYPHARMILTGNEKFLEVTNFKILLEQEGHTDFIEEKLSLTTWDNMRNSLHIMRSSHNLPRVLVITSDYHQPRSLAMARSVGMMAEVFGKDSVVYEKAKRFFLKERFSNLYYAPQIFWKSFKTYRATND